MERLYEITPEEVKDRIGENEETEEVRIAEEPETAPVVGKATYSEPWIYVNASFSGPIPDEVQDLMDNIRDKIIDESRLENIDTRTVLYWGDVIVEEETDGYSEITFQAYRHIDKTQD